MRLTQNEDGAAISAQTLDQHHHQTISLKVFMATGSEICSDQEMEEAEVNTWNNLKVSWRFRGATLGRPIKHNASQSRDPGKMTRVPARAMVKHLCSNFRPDA